MSAHLKPGSIFARDYRVVQQLGEGGMGSVYIVEQKSTGARRALKLMLPHLAADAEARERFEREAKVGSRIPSDHVVHVIAAGFDEETSAPWIAMELLEGESLDARVRGSGPLSIAEARDLFAQLGHALRAAHAVDVVHRDLKPENLHVGTGRRAGERMSLKVLDFGIAKIVSDAGESATAPIGTLAWMAPEQTEASGISVATDVWSLGLIAFWALTGKSYWLSANAGEGSAGRLVRELVVEPLVNASERARNLGAPELPAGFDAWFSRAVIRNPKARFRDGGEACDALVALLGAVNGGEATTLLDIASAPTELAVSALAASAKRPVPRRRARVLLGALGFAAVAALGVFSLVRKPAPGEPTFATAPPSGSATASASASASASATPITSLPPPACSNEKALGLYASSLQAIRDANWDHSTARLREAAALEPTCAMIQLRLAQASDGDERSASYARAVEGRKQLKGRDRDLLAIWEPALREPRDLAAALERATSATRQYPRDAEFFGFLCMAEPDPRRAKAACRTATEIDPDYGAAWNDLGSRLDDLGEADEARAAFDSCIVASPTTTGCRTGRAQLHERSGRCSESEVDLRQAVASNPTSYQIHLDWAEALFGLGQPREAVLEAVKQSITLRPEARRDVDGGFQLMEWERRFGRWDEAARHLAGLERLLAASTDAGDQENLAAGRVTWLLSLGRDADAGKTADEYMRRRQGWGGVQAQAGEHEPEMLYARFRARLVSEEQLRASRKDWLDRIRTRFPDDSPLNIWNIWAMAFMTGVSLGDREEALRAISGKPEGEPPHQTMWALGTAYTVAGRYADALPLLRRGAAGCGVGRAARTSLPLAMALEGTGDVAGACEIYGQIADVLGQHQPLPPFVKRAAERRAKLTCK